MIVYWHGRNCKTEVAGKAVLETVGWEPGGGEEGIDWKPVSQRSGGVTQQPLRGGGFDDMPPREKVTRESRKGFED